MGCLKEGFKVAVAQIYLISSVDTHRSFAGSVSNSPAVIVMPKVVRLSFSGSVLGT